MVGFFLPNALAQKISQTDLDRLRELSPAQQKQIQDYLGSGSEKNTSPVQGTSVSAYADGFRIVPSDTVQIEDRNSTDPPTKPSAIVSSVPTEDNLPYFGYDIFGLSLGSLQPPEVGPVPPDYMIGPGDEVILTVWGDNELHTTLQVSREGYILLPDAGRLLVNGLTLEMLRNELTSQLSRVYSGIRRDANGSSAFVDVSLGKLRSIKIFIMGEVRQPGGYTVSAISNVFNALYYAGGPTIKGTMRKVELIRNNKKVAAVDIYDFLLAGENAQDIRLENGDAIFVGPVGPRVKMRGEIKRPAIYEIAEGETFTDVLNQTGGLKSTAYLRRAQIRRVVPFEQRSTVKDDWVTIDFDLEAALNGGQPIPLFDHDDIGIFAVGDELNNYVTITGDVVKKPGRYELLPDMKLGDLIRRADSLNGDVYWDYGHLFRFNQDKTQDIISFKLRDAVEGVNGDNLVLQARDSVRIYSIWDFDTPYQVVISGAVRRPGDYRLYGGMGLRDLIVMAGGVHNNAFVDTIEVSRTNNAGFKKKVNIIKVPVSKGYLEGKGIEIFELQKYDQVFIRELPDWKNQRIVSIHGEVKYPGEYALQSETETLQQLIARAGGLKPTAYPSAAVFTRAKNDAGRLSIDFIDVLKNRKSRYNLVLAEGDKIFIPDEPKTVKVVGEVNFPAAVLYEKGKSYRYYIEQAGGFGETADKGKVSIVMANGKVNKPDILSMTKPDAGATIIVPTKIEKEKGESLKDVASIIGIVSSAATTIFLIGQTTK